MDLNNFITKFGGWTESYPFTFPDGTTEELRYDPKEHRYYQVSGEDVQPLDGVTTICHIIDKSEALIPWACKQMALKLMATIPQVEGDEGDNFIRLMRMSNFTTLVNDAKKAHKEKLEDAGAVGHSAHAWIEDYIKRSIEAEAVIVGKTFDLPPYPEDERAVKCCGAAVNWMKAHNVRWLGTERKIFSRTYGYAGTMDGLCRVDSCNNPDCCPNEFRDRLTVADWKTSNYLYMEYLLQTAAYMQAYMEETGEQVEDRWIIRLGKDDGEFDPWHAEGPITFSDDWEGFKLALYLTRQVRCIKGRIKGIEDRNRAAVKVKKEQAKTEALALACKGSVKYKGVRPPQCNGGNPCKSCVAKFQQVQTEKSGQNVQTPV